MLKKLPSRFLVATIAVAAAALLAPSAPPAAAQPLDPPNVLIIVTDDQRADTMSAMPRTRSWFGDEGTRFTNAYVATPTCCPSRASIMTGRFAHNHGVRRNSDAGNLDHATTMQAHLDPTYQTAVAGKFLNGWDLAQNPPNFDRWAVTRNKTYFETSYNVDGVVGTDRGYATNFVREHALGFLDAFEEDDATPWYLYVAPIAPHWPYEPHPRDAGIEVPPWRNRPPDEVDRSDKPRFIRIVDGSVEEARSIRREQLRTLISVDRTVDALMDRLGELGEENTVAFFLSDNGYTWGEHDLVAKKGLPYTPSIRIPFLWRFPGTVEADVQDERFVQTIDIAPTVYELTGTVPTVTIDGKSLLHGARDRIFIEMAPARNDNLRVPEWASIRTETYQYVEYYQDGVVRNREYYDLTQDPHQLRNQMRGDDPPDTTAAAALLDLARTCMGPSCP